MNGNIQIPWPEWEITKVIGRGGFGTVYEIQKDVFGKKEYAALKVLSIPESAEEIDELYSRGYDEQSISAHFKDCLEDIVGEYSIMVDLKGHANVVYCDEVKYVQHDDGIGWDIFIKMELLKPLNKIPATEYNEEEVVRLGKDLCNALIYCNQQNIIHRDIKPQNIFVSKNGSYKLGDFGVAKVSDKTMSGTKIGTYEYMAPEVYRAQRYGARVDIYSLGLVMYWMMNQKCTPFLPLPPQIPTSSEKENARNRRLDGEQLPPPVNGSERLKAIVLKACAFDPQNRYASAQDMLNVLQNIGKANPKPIPEPLDLDVHKEMTFEHTNHPAGKYLSIQVEAREVHFSVPMDIKDGQTICLGGKGKYDGSTGTSGDLYITIHVKEAPPQPILSNNKIKYVAVAAVVVVLVVIFFLAKNSKHNHTWEAATCMQPKTCTECGETEGEPLAHALTDVGCTVPAVCINCGTIVQEARGHQWQEADDGTFLCTVCGEIMPREEGEIMPTEESVSVDPILSNAKEYVEKGQYREAIHLLDKAWKETGDQTYYDLAGDYRMEFGISNASYIAAGKYNSILIKDDGSVMVVGDNEYGELDAKYWSDIVAVSAGDRHIVGLRSNGTVVSAGSNDMGQREVSGWSDVIAISAGDVHTVALRKDGTLLAAGQLYTPRCDVDKLHSLAGEKRIVSIAAGYLHTLALLEDGTVIASGENGGLQCNVEEWTDIAAIYAGTDFSLGLKTDGTVVMASLHSWNFSGWTDIINLAAGDYFAVGITSTGAFLHFGIEENIGPGTPNTIPTWENPVQIAAGYDHFLVMNDEGLVRGVGQNKKHQIDIWDISVGTYPRN